MKLQKMVNKKSLSHMNVDKDEDKVHKKRIGKAKGSRQAASVRNNTSSESAVYPAATPVTKRHRLLFLDDGHKSDTRSRKRKQIRDWNQQTLDKWIEKSASSSSGNDNSQAIETVTLTDDAPHGPEQMELVPLPVEVMLWESDGSDSGVDLNANDTDMSVDKEPGNLIDPVTGEIDLIKMAQMVSAKSQGGVMPDVPEDVNELFRICGIDPNAVIQMDEDDEEDVMVMKVIRAPVPQRNKQTLLTDYFKSQKETTDNVPVGKSVPEKDPDDVVREIMQSLIDQLSKK
jgi:hypothetical protein